MVNKIFMKISDVLADCPRQFSVQGNRGEPSNVQITLSPTPCLLPSTEGLRAQALCAALFAKRSAGQGASIRRLCEVLNPTGRETGCEPTDWPHLGYLRGQALTELYSHIISYLLKYPNRFNLIGRQDQPDKILVGANIAL